MSEHPLLSNSSWEQLTIENDFLFCKIMTAYPHLLLELLRRILPERNIKEILFPEPQKSVKIGTDIKGIRVDVYARASDGRPFFL